MKTCLVLEGGALRGIFTAGVLDELIKDNIKIDAIIGVSMGSLIAVNYLSNQPGRAIRYNKKYCKDKRYMGIYPLLKEGNIVSKQFAYYDIPEKLDKFDYDTYKKSKIKLYCTVTNLATGKAEYIEIKDAKKDIEILRAGSSMPGVSKIVKVGSEEYLDGGIADSIPVRKAIEMGFDKIIVVETRPLEYRKKNKIINTLNFMYKKYPKFLSTIQKRNIKYNEEKEEIIELEKLGRIFVIRPSRVVPIKRIEKNEKIIQEQYDLGRRDYIINRDKIFKYLKKKKRIL